MICGGRATTTWASMLGFLNDREGRATRHLATAGSTGDRRARQQCPLDWVQHAWRVGGQVIWDDFAGQIGTLDADELRGLVRSAGDVWQVVGEFTVEMSAAHHAVERDIGTPDRRVHELMHTLFDRRATSARQVRLLGRSSAIRAQSFPGTSTLMISGVSRSRLVAPQLLS